MMTEETLNKIIEGAKKQLRHEERCIEALEVIFPESYPPVPANYLWDALAEAVDAALGLEEFFDWWVWDTNCGTTGSAWIELDGVRYPVTNASEILAYAEAERTFIEDKKSAEDKVCG